MSGLLTAVMLGAALSLPAAGLAWLAASILARRACQAAPKLWRSARLVAILPLVLAPVLYAVPQPRPVPPVLEFLDEPDLSLPTTGAVQHLRPLATSSRALPTLELWLVVAYMLGLAVALLLALRRHHLRRTVLAHGRPADRHERLLLDREAGKLGVRSPDMRLCPRATSPFLTGWRGVIVAPESLLRTPDLARHALVHELCHLRRGDERDRLLGSALTILLWFNWPLRQIERELDAARELACDRDAIEALGQTERKAYAAALIETMRSTAQPVSAFGPHDRRHREMRIKAILSGGHPGRHSVLTAVALLLLAIPVAGAQSVITPRRPASAPVDQLAPVVVAQPANPATAPAAGPALAPVSAVAPVMATAAAPLSTPAAPTVPSGAPDLPRPVLDGRVTSVYGPRPARPAGSPVFHGGTDIAASTGAAISAPGAGTVVHAEMGYQGSERWGNTIEIAHGDGWSTVYAHLDTINVEPGQAVAAGDQIGTVGTTGASTGPHVHVELHHDGERVDPAGIVPGLR
ncbi:peptidoglycan DD-metalloendopeptidase family protein [Maricaulis sp.]|uniref:peptidoglycan DD-metalloendopeptidase family protein n=1 Tax=Maricaulis sp. TaxID=1486257 RepID=UPI003A9528AD